MTSSASDRSETWPSLPLEAWSETYATLHMWTQIVGKIRLAQSPWVNHSWHVTLYVTARGLTTSPIPYGTRTFQIDFDFIDHRLTVAVERRRHRRRLALEPQSVATFYARLMEELGKLDLHVKIYRKAQRGRRPHPASTRTKPTGPTIAEYANRFWRILVQADRVFKEFRARFIGKCSPVHFFWGAPDLAVTRFSGREAPEHPGRDSEPARLGDPGGLLARSQQLRVLARRRRRSPIPRSIPMPIRSRPGSRRRRSSRTRPSTAPISASSSCPTTSVRQSESPDDTLLDFLQTTYEAAANLANWDRAALERGHDPRARDERR